MKAPKRSSTKNADDVCVSACGERQRLQSRQPDLRTSLRGFVAGVAIIASCLLLGWFLLHDRRSSTELGVTAILICAVAWYAYILGIPRVLPRRAPESLILMATAAVLASATQWNVRYLRYVRTLENPLEVFR